MELYNKYKKVPKEALKAFDNGSFKGSDINTMWRIKCLTETFGACGVGWYYNIEKTWTEQGVNDEIMCFAEIKLYIKVDNEWSMGINATGGSKLVRKFKAYTANNDDGYKMAITDALGVACKLLGLGADVYWENDVSKYTDADSAVEYTTDEQIAELESFGVDALAVAKYLKVSDIKQAYKQHIDTILQKKRKESAGLV